MTILLYELVGHDAARPFSPHCWKAAMALAHKGLDFESVPTPFTAVPSVEGGVSKIVPVIRDGDKTVSRFLRHRALSGGRLSGPADAVRRRRRQGDGALHRALVAADHPSLSRFRRADGHPRRAGAGGPGLFPQEPRGALRQAAGRGAGRARGRARRLPRLAGTAQVMLTYQPWIGGAFAAVSPTTSSSAPSSGCASPRPSRCLPRTIRWPNGSAAASTCMAASAAGFRRRHRAPA